MKRIPKSMPLRIAAPKRKAYSPPLVMRVELEGEEVVLGSCKTESGSPANSSFPLSPCAVCGASLGS